MTKFNELLYKIGEDKVLHFETCCLIVLLSCLVCMKFGMVQALAVWCSFVFAMAIGVAKEFYDARSGEFFDGSDVRADAAGAIVGVLIITLFG